MKRTLLAILTIFVVAAFTVGAFAEGTKVYPTKRIDDGVITNITDTDPGHYVLAFEIDSAGAGVAVDTVNFLIPFEQFNAGWLCWGIVDYDSTHADATNCHVVVSARPGTIFHSKWREPNGIARYFTMNNRGKHTDLLDSIYPVGVPQPNLDSLFAIPLDSTHMYAGGWGGADSTFLMDWINVQFVVTDSLTTQTGDTPAWNDQKITFSLLGIFKNLIWRQR